jgi:hypothetical protein
VLRREQANRGARVGFVGELLQAGGQRRDEGLVGATQHEPEQRARRELRVGDAGVVERPARQIFHESFAEISERRAFGASQNDDQGGAVAQAKVDQVIGESVILGAGVAHVFDGAQGADAGARAPRELLHQLGRHGGVQQLLLAGEVLVQVANGRPGALGDGGHGGGFEAQFGEGFGGGRDEALAHVLFRDLSH